jgi:hypothetical protein
MTTVLSRTALAGSNTGGIRETQEMLDFCAIQNIKPQITKIAMDGINDAWSKVIAKQARYRFVLAFISRSMRDLRSTGLMVAEKAIVQWMNAARLKLFFVC